MGRDPIMSLVASWLEALRFDRRCIAASKAQHIVDWMPAQKAEAHQYRRGAE